jgi:hypothetical protein
MSSLEERISKTALEYETNPKQQYSNSTEAGNQKFGVWYLTTHHDFRHRLLTLIQENGDHFVEYWPAQFVWGVGSEQKVSGDSEYIRTYEYKYGSFSSGYLCLSDKSIYMVAIAELGRKFAIIHNDFVSGMFKGIGGMMDQRRLLREDKTRTLPYDTIRSSDITRDDDLYRDMIQIRTAAETIRIYSHFSDTLEEMATGIKMGMSGKLARIWQAPTNGKNIDLQTSHDIPELLRMLAALRDAGILSREEFDDKSKKLLSRL